MAPRRRFYRRASRDKYSVENTAFTATINAETTTSVPVVPPTAVRGMRKVKHVTISMSTPGNTNGGVFWALVYVPEGYTPQAFGVPTLENPSADLYSANQFVMSSGVMDLDAGPQRISSRLSRNLNSGDSIVLLLRNATGGPTTYYGVVHYAITLQ